MKYIVMDYVDGDLFNTECESKEEAVTVANRDWNRLSDSDKEKRESFFVLESVNEDEEAEDHFDGNVIISFK